MRAAWRELAAASAVLIVVTLAATALEAGGAARAWAPVLGALALAEGEVLFARASGPSRPGSTSVASVPLIAVGGLAGAVIVVTAGRIEIGGWIGWLIGLAALIGLVVTLTRESSLARADDPPGGGTAQALREP